MSRSGVEADAAQALYDQMACVEAAPLLAELAALPGVTAVCTKPVPPATKPNHFGVAFKLRVPGKGRKSKRISVTEAEGERLTFLVAVQSAIGWVTAFAPGGVMALWAALC
eukprot:1068275-Prymnesium_polylepis.1